MNVRRLFPRRLMLVAGAIVIVGGIALVAFPILTGGGASYPIATHDRIASWNLPAPYKDGAQKEADTKGEIARLDKLLGSKGASDYDIEVGIASEYELIGDGKSAYRYLARAIALNPSRGLAYFNMGHLMEALGALLTAKNAYTDAVRVEPADPLYIAAQKDFAARHPNL